MRTPCIVSILLGAALVGCLTEEPDRPEIDGPITATTVTVHADGSFTSVQREVSVDEQLAEREARLEVEGGGDDSGALARIVAGQTCVDYLGLGMELRIFDRPDFAGNRLCLRREGEMVAYVDLRQIPYTCWNAGFPPRLMCSYWNDKVRSYRPGPDRGLFHDDDTGTMELIREWMPVLVAGVVASNADRIMLLETPKWWVEW